MKKKKEDEQEEVVKVKDQGYKVKELEKCEDQLTGPDENPMNQEEDQRVPKKMKRRLSRIGKATLWKNKEKDRKRKTKFIWEKKIKKKKGNRKRREKIKKVRNRKTKKESVLPRVEACVVTHWAARVEAHGEGQEEVRGNADL